MKTQFLVLLWVVLTPWQTVDAQQRRSLLDADPDAVYLKEVLEKPLRLAVAQEAPVFSDAQGTHRLGTLRANQNVVVEAITDRVYRVRGQGTRDGIAGWVAPWAFTSPEPDFVDILKKFYEREMAVKTFIDAGEVAVGMTPDEVSRCKGRPNKTSTRKTETGQVARWDFIEYEQVKHYTTQIDPVTRRAYRVLSHVTQEERGRLTVEFENGLVTAIEETTQDRPGNVRIVVPPIVFRW